AAGDAVRPERARLRRRRQRVPAPGGRAVAGLARVRSPGRRRPVPPAARRRRGRRRARARRAGTELRDAPRPGDARPSPRPGVADSLIFTWLGALPPSTPGSGWFHLGPARFVGVRVLVRPPEGVGSILTGVEMDGRLELTLSYLTGLFSPREAERYLELAEAS